MTRVTRKISAEVRDRGIHMLPPFCQKVWNRGPLLDWEQFVFSIAAQLHGWNHWGKGEE